MDDTQQLALTLEESMAGLEGLDGVENMKAVASTGGVPGMVEIEDVKEENGCMTQKKENKRIAH